MVWTTSSLEVSPSVCQSEDLHHPGRGFVRSKGMSTALLGPKFAGSSLIAVSSDYYPITNQVPSGSGESGRATAPHEHLKLTAYSEPVAGPNTVRRVP